MERILLGAPLWRVDMLRRLALLSVVTAFALIPSLAQASLINFENLTGPSTFDATTAPQSPQYIFGPLTVDITGGVILDQTASLPANQTSIYGTASFCCGTGSTPNLITVTFSSPIQNFFLDVLNGNIVTVTYRMSDNNGNVADFSLPPNLSSGQTQIGFAATGTVVTIQALTGLPFYDFFIDNIRFNEDLPGAGVVPEPTTMILLGSGLVGVGLRRFRRRRV